MTLRTASRRTIAKARASQAVRYAHMQNEQSPDLGTSAGETPPRRFFQYVSLFGPALFLGRLVPKEKLLEYVHFTEQNARDFLLLRLLTEVQKVGFVMGRWNDFLDRRAESPQTDAEEQGLDSLVDEQSLWQRKLLEGLVLLINFSSTNESNYYYHFLLLQELEHYRGMLKEQEDFFQHGSALTGKTVGRLVQQVERIETDMGLLTKCWYLPDPKPVHKRKAWPVLASLRQQLKSALSVATRREKTALGYTYGLSYGEMSGNIHFGATRLDYTSLDERFSFGLAQCGLLSIAILQRAHDLTNVMPEGINARLMTADRNSPSKSNPTVKRLEKGDFVFADGPHLGEVIDVVTSVFGYEGYLIEYLADTPLEGIDRAWFPSVEVQLFMKRKEIAEGVLAQLKRDASEADTPALSISDAELQQATKEAVIELWRAGLAQYTKRVVTAKRKGDRGLGYDPGAGGA